MRGVKQKLFRRRKSEVQGLNPGALEKLSKQKTTELLKMTYQLMKVTLKSFWLRHKLASRLIAIGMVLLILFGIFVQVYDPKKNVDAYDISQYAEQFLGTPIPLYAEKLKFDQKQQAYIFNEGYAPGGDVSGDSYAPKISAVFKGAPDNSVTVTDPENEVSVTLKPRFRLLEPQQREDKLLYPIAGLPATKVYSVKGTGVKEDILFSRAPSRDNISLSYDLQLSDGLEARIEVDGSVGVYGASSVLLGNVSAATESDAALLKKARDNAEKSRFIFGIPAPYVVEKDATSISNTVKSKFVLSGNTLTLEVSNMSQGIYPLSVDPTIYVETAAKLMRGNNESNIDFDTTNQLIQKSQTTGARIDAWEGNLDMSQATWDHGVAPAGGYIYRAGGRTGPAKPQIVDQQQTLDGSNGTSFVMNMPTTRPAGDLYVALMCHDGSNSNQITQTGGGWTEVTGSDVQGFVAYYKVGADAGGGNEAASYTFTGPSEEYAGVILRITGVDTSSPISASNFGSNASAVTPVFPTVTPAHDATLVVRAVGFDQDDPPATSWVPAGHTKIDSESSSNGGNGSCGFAAASLDTSPVSGVATGTQALAGGITDDYGGVSISIKPTAVTLATDDSVNWAKFNSDTLAIESPNPGTGVCSGWCTDADYDLPSARRGFSMVAYNGYLYAMGGLNSAGTRQSTVYIAKLGANGEPQLWHPTDTDQGNWVYWYTDAGLNGGTAKSYLNAYAYNNRMYVIGGQTIATPGGVTAVESAEIRPNGVLGTWTTSGMQALPAGAGTHMNTVHVYNDVMYTLGGFEGVATSSANMRSTVYYSKIASNGTMSSWVATTSFTTARATFGGSYSTIWGAYLYMTGGCTAVNGSGYCTTVASDTQIASLNADGTISEWGEITNLDNERIGYSLTAWQGGLYRLGGCSRQSPSTGECIATVADVDYGVVNPAGEVSTVDITVASGTAPCSGGSPTSCNLPSDGSQFPGDDAGEIGHMLNMSTILNGYLYVIGGCAEYNCNTGTNTPTTDNISSNTAYVAIAADGSLVAPSSCGGTSYGAWCVDSTNTINGADGVAAAGVAVFNNRIYVLGGLDSTAATTGELYYNTVNPTTGALTGAWTTQTLASVGIAENIFYTYIYARANPSQAGTYDGNLYVFGGCGDGGSGAGCANNDYETEVYKCWIEDTGEIEDTTGSATFDCTTSGQLQIDSTPPLSYIGDVDLDGLGIHSGTVYANYIYLIGGISQNETDKDDVIYARFDDSNNVVAASGSAWVEPTNKLSVGRRRGWAFGYNGHIYAVGGYDDTVGSALPFIEWSKINVSDGSIGAFVTSSVQINQRWGLNVAVSNSYAYVIGGCDVGISPGGCSSFEPAVQTFQLYNNDSGGVNNYTAQSDDTFSTIAVEDRWGASAVVYNGYLYVAGGCISATDCTDATNSTQYAPIAVADGTIGTWSAGGNLPADRAWGGLEVAGGTLYYVGGQNDGGTAQTSIYYTSSISSGNPTWATATATLPEARTKFGSAVWNNRLYVVGGLNATPAVTNTVLVSGSQSAGGNMSGGSWTTSSTSFDVARRGHAVTIYANNLYLFGGFDGTNFLSDVQFASIGYKTGTIGQAGTTVTGSGTTFTAAMVGSVLQYPDGSTATITAYSSATSITVSANKTVASSTLFTVLDGSVGSWTFTTSLPDALSDARAVSANGYIYLVGGRTATATCNPKTLITPISANTTNATGNNPTGVGEWYETNVRYADNRYGAAVAYDSGKIYTMGGGCTAPIDCSTASVCHYYSTVRSQPQVAIYSRMIDTDTNVFPNSWLMNGLDNSVGARWQGQYRSSTDASNVVFHESFDDGSNGTQINGTNDGSTNSDYNSCYNNNGPGTATHVFSNAWSITSSLSSLYTTTGSASTACDFAFSDTSTSTTRFDRFYINVGSLPAADTVIYNVYDNNTADTVAELRIRSAANGGTLQLRDRFTAEDEITLGTGVHRIEVGIIADQMTVRVYSGANLHTETISDSDVIDLDLGPNNYDELNFGIVTAVSSWSLGIDEHKASVSNWVGSAYPSWGQISASSDVIMGDVATFIPRNIAGTDTDFARWYFFRVSIDASKTFGYPEDVSRGPTISDLSLFFTSDPNKRLRHGKTFTGGEQQPLDTPCRQSVDAECPLP